MKWITLIASLLAAGCNDAGQEVVHTIAPAELAESGSLPDSVRVVRADNLSSSDYLVVEHTGSDAPRILITTIATPGVTLPVYAIEGEVRYEDVAGDAYLMTLNYWADGGPAYSKGILSRGPARKISGTSGWRPFVLPFSFASENGGDSGNRPTKIELHLVLPGAGKVHLRNMRLTQFALGANPLASTGQWWTGAQAGLVGGSLGGLFGCMGGLIGYLASRGRGRGFALALMSVMIALGAASLIMGVIALMLSQPYDVYYSLFLGGGLFVLLPAVQLPMIRRRYAEMELRKMSAIDAGLPST